MFVSVVTGELEKSAAGGKAGLLSAGWNGLKGLVQKGVWSNVADATANSTGKIGKGLNSVARVFYNPATQRRTRLGGILDAYGMTAMVPGLALPGASLAMNIGMPGAGMLMEGIPSAITAGRASTTANKERIKADAMIGSQQATSDLISALQYDKGIVKSPNAYLTFLQQNRPEMMGLYSQYATGGYKPMGWWDTAKSLWSDPQKLISSGIDEQIYKGMQNPNAFMKQAMMKAIGTGLKTVGGGIMKALPWTIPVGGTVAIGSAALSDKPYDDYDAMSRGYAATQVKLNEALNGMSGMERMAAGLDPTLVMQKLEEKMPGSIANWQNTTGYAYQPGWLSNMANSFKGGGSGKFYTYDMNGNRQYVG